MEDITKDIYQFFLEKTWNLTEVWYQTLDKSDPTGVYSSSDPKAINELKQQNYQFHKNFCQIFIIEETDFYKNFEDWVTTVTRSDSHLATPVPYMLREFFRTQEQYLDLFDSFLDLVEDHCNVKDLQGWRRKIIRAFETIVTWFIDDYYNVWIKKLESQQETIKELSSPIIPVGGNSGILPLIGDIDTGRAKFIMENTLNECIKNSLEILYIDLSGVAIIDTMVSQELFKLIEALNLIGVKAILSGMRPALAQTAVQLGLNFEHVQMTSKLHLVND